MYFVKKCSTFDLNQIEHQLTKEVQMKKKFDQELAKNKEHLKIISQELDIGKSIKELIFSVA